MQAKIQKVSYENVNIYVGIDAHMKRWKATNVLWTFGRDSSPVRAKLKGGWVKLMLLIICKLRLLQNTC